MFPCGSTLLTFSTRMIKITQKSVSLYANFSEKGCLDLSGNIYCHMRTFPKGSFISNGNNRDVASDVGVNLCNVKSCLNTSNNEIFTDK